MTGYELHPGDVPEWVEVVSGPALFAVVCERCGVTDAAYHVVVARNRSWLTDTVRAHRDCQPKVAA